MNASAPSPRVARFGLFELDLQTGELRKKGLRVALQEQPFQVLARLVSRPGELVTRDELRSALWADAVFVDFDHGLNKAVAKIRQALGDLADSPRFVETLERRGYRFIAPVELGPPIGTGPSTRATDPLPSPIVRVVIDDRSIPLASGVHEIGRDPSVAVWIASSFVSRRHARLTVDGRGITLEDLGSHNGTCLNGERISSPQPLRNGDEIRVGPARLVVYTDAAATITLSQR